MAVARHGVCRHASTWAQTEHQKHEVKPRQQAQAVERTVHPAYDADILAQAFGPSGVH